MEKFSAQSKHENLAEVKGWSPEYAAEANNHVSGIAAEVGLEYHMDKAIIANSFDAHRMVQYAKTQGKGDAAEEQLFKAYFTDGKNTADHATLVELGSAIGLNREALTDVLNSNQFSDNVTKDIHEAQQIGVRGVPFFVLDRKYAVSGAQQPETFLGALSKSFEEWESSRPIAVVEGTICTPEGDCL
jgi:predicted DsbA family dithiol-disulfide isomerase